mgnify:CR=1 FL=1
MPSFRLKENKLPSGLRTVLLPRAEGETVTFLVLVGVGSRYETPKQSGLSHFLEHMFFKGTEKRPTAKEIAEAVDGVGGEMNAFTGEEYTGYYVKVAAKHVNRAADVVSDILLKPLFPQEEIDRERGVITEEIRMYTDTPMRHIWHLWHEALFGKAHPLGRRIDGSEETVAAFMRPDFVSYTGKHYQAGNAVVTVAGKFDPAKMSTRLATLFADLPDGAGTHPKKAPGKQPAKRFVHEHRGHLDQTHLMIGAPGVAQGAADRYAAEVLATILGSGMSSRLFMAVRERNGLAYSVRTGSDNFTDTGSFTTQAGVRTDKAAQALQLIVAEYDRIMEEPVGQHELNKAKQMLRGQMLLGLEETNALALYAGMQTLLRKKITKPNEVLKKIDAVTPAAVQKVAQRLLAPKKRAVALLGPQKSTKAFEKLLH